MKNKTQKWLQRLPHLICGAVIIIVLIVLISKVFNFLDGDVIEEYPIEVVHEVGRRNVSWVFDKILQLYFGI